MNNIWTLDHDVDNFKYLARHDDRKGKFPVLDGTSLWGSWEPQYVRYSPIDFREGIKIPNFPSWSGLLVCDLQAKTLLRHLIGDHVEFLPLSSHTIIDKQYFVINTLEVLDCLDSDLSEFKRLKSGSILSIQKYVMKNDCIGDIPVFKLPEKKHNLPYVDDRFKQIVEDNNLTGLTFRKIWEE